MRFKDFLQETAEKHAVLAFGRMNPPTTGHEVLVNKVQDVAKHFKASHHIVLSHSQDKAKNPLSSEQKLKHAQRFFPKANLSVATKDEPNFLTQAAKLHKQGVTHLHMVAGSDRTDEYYKLLHKYNGTHKGALFNFKHIKVHSAGERDPDAEGTTGMSASKMRQHAASGDFKSFRKGIPAHVKDEHAKELFSHVRQGMGIKESLDEEFQQFLIEGVHDKGIFKAVFLGGGPGSGKDFVLDKTLTGHGLVEINSDKALEFLMDKNNLDMRMPENEAERRDVVRGKAKSITELKQRLALFGRNGVIINGTGDDPEKIAKIKERLESLGYDTSMIMVNTADDVSQSRNIERGQRGGRTVPEHIRKKKWDSVQTARPELAKLFKDKYVEFDNSEDLRTAPPEIIQQKQDEMMNLYKNVEKFIKQPPKNPSATSWVASELDKKDTLPIKKDKEVVPHAGSAAYDEARKLGLQYYGFGRYGKNGKVTHRSVHDKLVQVEKQKEPQLSNIPTPGSSGMKKVNEELMNEAITVSVTADTTEELNQAFEKLFNKTTEKEVEESMELSGTDSMNLLTLGKEMTVSENRKDSTTLSNKDVHRILNFNDDDYITDKNGKARKFALRAAAAREAHQRNGIVEPVKGGGYFVKLKENQDVSVSKEIVLQHTDNGCSNSGSGSSGILTEETCSQKTSLKEIRTKQKEKYQESIDKGIEPGLSMAAAGESPARDMGEKIKKGRLGKASQVTETIGSGAEMANSMGDQKEDELKKARINLSTFKSKRFI